MTTVFIGYLLITFIQFVHKALSDTVERSDTRGGTVRCNEYENSSNSPRRGEVIVGGFKVLNDQLILDHVMVITLVAVSVSKSNQCQGKGFLPGADTLPRQAYRCIMDIK